MSQGTYQGKQVKSMRPATSNDHGFDASKGEQVVITMQDGTEKTVAKSEVKSDGAQGAQR